MACSESCQCPRCMVQPGEIYPPEPTDSELRQRLLDEGFDLRPDDWFRLSSYSGIAIQCKDSEVFIQDETGDSVFITCNSLASVVELAICIKKATEPMGVEL